MVVIRCTKTDCDWASENRNETLAAVLAAELANHTAVSHGGQSSQSNSVGNRKTPSFERPKIDIGGTEESWSVFLKKWDLFKSGTNIQNSEINNHLFQCCVDSLGDDLLRGLTDVASVTENDLLKAIKKLAVQPVARGVRRTELINMQQDAGEPIRSFHAKVKGRAVTCAYSVKCSCTTPSDVDYTEWVIKDVLLNGLADGDIKRDILGLNELDTLTVEDLVARIESKETARNALQLDIPSNDAISTFKREKTADAVEVKKLKMEIKCLDCERRIKAFVRGRGGKLLERKYCKECYITNHKNRDKVGKTGSSTSQDKNVDETASLMSVGAMRSVPPLVRKGKQKAILLDHHIFLKDYGFWRRQDPLPQPTVRVQVFTKQEDFEVFERTSPLILPSFTDAVADTGAQSCLMGSRLFYRCGFKKVDLIPVKNKMIAANKEPITILGAICLRISGSTHTNRHVETAALVYISPDTEKFYLSCETMKDLNIIDESFPNIQTPDDARNPSLNVNGHAERVSGMNISDNTLPQTQLAECGCHKRTKPPPRPAELPFKCTAENIPQMRQWILDRYKTSTFNKCSHQQLPLMEGPPIKILLNPEAKPVMYNTPATIPIHWMEDVKRKLEEDVRLGVIEQVPMGEKPTWCFRMVLARKEDGSPRRTVDLSPLNKFCSREPHHVQSPFQQARSIPANTVKTVMDAWNGYHSVPIAEADRHLTTFITPFGRFRYRTAPQGFKASGDGYTRRYDEIIADVERKTKAVDDTVVWDDKAEMKDHWWRVLDYLDLVGRNGIIINPEKFQFCEEEVDFAGFRVSSHKVEPLPKFMAAIQNFPQPKNITDIRSWFGLVNQCSHYNQLGTLMLPFKHLLSPNTSFVWTSELSDAFEKSKSAIVEAIKHGVEIFDPEKPTCLRTDYSQTGIGFFLGQKHCSCREIKVGCCSDGWRITLAGSRFLRPAETRFAPVEGESLGVVWALEQTRYFTLGCDTLIVAVDHKPLVKLFGDRTLDEITNTRLFRLKQRALPWKFTVQYVPGKLNPFADATSRYPAEDTDSENDTATITETLASIRLVENMLDDHEDKLEVASATADLKGAHTVSWARVRSASSTDSQLQTLSNYIRFGFPDSRDLIETEVHEYWQYRNDLSITDGVILFKGRTVIPRTLRAETLAALHAAHQGVSAMSARAQDSIFWPGLSVDIQKKRDSCSSCIREAPSQPRMPPIEPIIPNTPFECLAADYFHFAGKYYLVIADRLSGWTEVKEIKASAFTNGAAGLCAALRSLFCVFGVPAEISSDSGPEFKSHETKSFLERWGIRHRVSSSYHAESNGRAELAVKATKRLLRENTGPEGSLNTDAMVKALLVKRNTPDPDCKLSPAEVVFGRKLRDTLPCKGLQNGPMVYQNQDIAKKWRDTWDLKEQALKHRYLKSLERLDCSSKLLLPLRVGDRVYIQNQAGRYATKWDKTGQVIETHKNDQYVVKVDGSGRLTLRNRKFLKLATHHKLHGGVPPQSLPCPVTLDTPNPTVVIPESSQKPVDGGQVVAVPSVPYPATVDWEEASGPPVSPPQLDTPSSAPEQPPPSPPRGPLFATPTKPALRRELQRIGDFNKPGLTEMKSPVLPRTRSGKIP